MFMGVSGKENAWLMFWFRKVIMQYCQWKFTSDICVCDSWVEHVISFGILTSYHFKREGIGWEDDGLVLRGLAVPPRTKFGSQHSFSVAHNHQ